MNSEEREALIVKLCPAVGDLSRDGSGHLVMNQHGTLYYNFLQHKFAFRLELRGLKMSKGSLLKSAKEKGYIPKNTRTKAQAYAFICELDNEIKSRFDILKQAHLDQQKEEADVVGSPAE